MWEFDHEERVCLGIGEFGPILEETERDPRALIIRRKLKSHLNPGHPVRRMSNGPGACFDEYPRHLTGIDIDDTLAPEGMSPISDEALEYAVSRLPPEFHNVSYVAQFSSKAGLSRSGRKIKAHLWFGLSTPATSEQMRLWAESTNGLADPALYKTVQPHYTSRPPREAARERRAL